MSFEKVKKNFGFGLMRLPESNGEIDYPAVNEMVDTFMANGFNYFDTAKGYHNGLSEEALRECVVKRYPRESFTVTNKLTENYFNSEEDIYALCDTQLKTCGVDYFDFYLMHAQGKGNYPKYQACHAYETAQKLKAQGKVKHVGLSFHDSAAYLEQILTDHPEVELVQIQLNYVDYEDPGVQSRACLEVCNRHNKPVVVMEPVKGGSLVHLPAEADSVLRALNGGSNASYAIRFAASRKGVFMVLSGMSNMEQMLDNVGYMREFKPLSEEEERAIERVCDVFRKQNLIACTGCRYCVAGCPKRILIPDLFADMNMHLQHKTWNPGFYYSEVHTKENGRAGDCIGCGKCEKVCPQHLPVRELLKEVSKTFDR